MHAICYIGSFREIVRCIRTHPPVWAENPAVVVLAVIKFSETRNDLAGVSNDCERQGLWSREAAILLYEEYRIPSPRAEAEGESGLRLIT
jgi:hypothetical protein